MPFILILISLLITSTTTSRYIAFLTNNPTIAIFSFNSSIIASASFIIKDKTLKSICLEPIILRIVAFRSILDISSSKIYINLTF